jgi:tetratricopeptide (TPR) repeat protein
MDEAARKAFDAVTRECEAKLADYRAALARQPDDLESAHEVEAYLSILGSRMLHVGEFDAALAAYGEALAFGRDQAARDPTDEWTTAAWLARTAFALADIGRVKLEMGNHAGARQAYEEALGIARDHVARGSTSEQWPKYLSWNLDYIGDLCLKEGDLAGARRAYEESLAIHRDHVARFPAYMEYSWAMAKSLANLGDVAREAGDAAGAERLHLEAHAIRREICEQENHGKT